MTKTTRVGGAFNKDTKTASKAWNGRGATTALKCPLMWQIPLSGVTNGWMRKFSILNTFPCPTGTIRRKTLVGKEKKYTPRVFPCPAIIGAYNRGKVGTDRMDQTVSYYYKNRPLR